MHSFDIFDTVITRRTAAPEGIFAIMQEIMRQRSDFADISDYVKENFYVLRMGAEELARKEAYHHKKDEITLAEIYRALATTSCLTKDQAFMLQKLEMETELNNILPIQETIGQIRKLDAEGQRVVLISDMYLSKNNIIELLGHVDPVLDKMPVYVSTEFGVTKANGQLYRIVAEHEDADYAFWHHMGDNKETDVQVPCRIGIAASQKELPAWKPWEEKFVTAGGNDYYWQLSLGASRYTKLQSQCGTPGLIGCTIGGPLLYPYICWVLEESIKRDIARLYFVARDGWILKQIADKIIEKRGYCLTTAYCYGSRKAWRMPEYLDLENKVQLLQYSEEAVTVDDIAAGLDISKNEFITIFPWLPEAVKNGEAPLWGDIRKRVFSYIAESREFRKILCDLHKQKFEMAKKYLRQEIEVSDGNFAFVELSGTGVTQSCLAAILSDFCQFKVRSFYLKMDRVKPADNCEFINYYPGDRQNSYMIELLCRAPHGQTEGYVFQGDKISPVLEEKEGKYISEYGLEEYKNALLCYVEQMENAAADNQLSYGKRVDLVMHYMKLIGESNDRELMEYFGNMPFDSEGSGQGVKLFAPLLTKRQIRDIYFWRWVEPISMYYKGAALDYSMLRGGRKAAQYKKRCETLREWDFLWIQRLREKVWKRKQYAAFHIPHDIPYYCPWDWFEGTVVLYGAGKVGQSYYRQLKKYFGRSYFRSKYGQCQKLYWVDANYQKYQNSKMQINPPDIIRKIDYDRVIIAIKEREMADQITGTLKGMGVDAKYICWCYPVYR